MSEKKTILCLATAEKQQKEDEKAKKRNGQKDRAMRPNECARTHMRNKNEIISQHRMITAPERHDTYERTQSEDMSKQNVYMCIKDPFSQ